MSMRLLIGMRMADRSILDALGRQAALVKIETKEIEREITRYCECFLQEGNKRIHEKNEALHEKLEPLQNRFKTLQTVREVHNIVRTSDEDLRNLQTKMRVLSSEIDAGRLQDNAGVTKIEKQLHQFQLHELSMGARSTRSIYCCQSH
jgi:hypothetical protein